MTKLCKSCNNKYKCAPIGGNLHQFPIICEITKEQTCHGYSEKEED